MRQAARGEKAKGDDKLIWHSHTCDNVEDIVEARTHLIRDVQQLFLIISDKMFLVS